MAMRRAGVETIFRKRQEWCKSSNPRQAALARSINNSRCVWERSVLGDATMHKLAVAFFYACAILSLPVMVHAVARAEMAKAEFQDLYHKALGVTLGLIRVEREAPGTQVH